MGRKGKRVAIQREAEKSGERAEPFGSDAFETLVVLNDFLDHCQRTGILSVFERDLLIRLKVDGFFAKEIIHTHTAFSEKAVHWRVERILQRLQKAANDLGIKSASFSLAVSSQNPQKRKYLLTMGNYISSGNRMSCPLVIVEGNSLKPRPSRAHRKSNRTPRSIGTC